jgi:hypothetical protein
MPADKACEDVADTAPADLGAVLAEMKDKESAAEPSGGKSRRKAA